jgi:hypothetical protein
MAADDGKPIQIQILEARQDTGSAGRGVAIAREHFREVADIGRSQGAEALLVCPAPEEYTGEGIDLVVAARFGRELDEDAVFNRQRCLAREIYNALRVEAAVVDLDLPLDGLLKHIGHLLASPYRDEIGRRGGVVSGI